MGYMLGIEVVVSLIRHRVRCKSLMNNIEKEQVEVNTTDGNDEVLGGFLSGPKEQMIESLGEAIINYIIDSDRLKTLKYESRSRVESSHKALRRGSKIHQLRPYISLYEIIPENNRELLKSIKQHVWAKEYLGVIEVLYQEIFVEDPNFPFGRESNYETFELREKYYTLDLNLLIRIEVFMLALIYQPTPAFIFFGSSGLEIRKEQPHELKNRITRLGFELLYLIDKKNDIENFQSEALTRNVKILIDFLRQEGSHSNRENIFSLNQDLTFDSLTDLNNLLLRLKAFAETGSLKKNLMSSQTYRQRDGGVEPATRLVRASRIEMTKDWGNRSKQLNEAIIYFQKYNKQNILLCRTQIYLVLEKGRVTAEQFQKIFGNINKKAKKPNGLQGYLDFLYFWSEDFRSRELKLDLICIYDTNTLLQVSDEPSCKQRNLRTELKEFWQANLEDPIFEGQNVQLQFKPIPILQDLSYGLAPEFLIEAGDKRRWNIFEQKVLPYFIFLEFLDLNYTDEIRNRFKRGQSSK